VSADEELPRVLCDTAVVGGGAAPDAAGALGRLPAGRRDLDANLVQLPAGTGVDAHAGPDVDVLVSVVHGSGRLITAAGALELRPGVTIQPPP
jgi:hypothetical protein